MSLIYSPQSKHFFCFHGSTFPKWPLFLCRWGVVFQCRPPSLQSLQCAASVFLYGRSGATSPLLPPLCTFTSLLTFGWHSRSSAFPNPPRLGSRFKKSGWCNGFHSLKSTLDPRLTRREDICCTWDQSQVGTRKLHEQRTDDFCPHWTASWRATHRSGRAEVGGEAASCPAGSLRL